MQLKSLSYVVHDADSAVECYKWGGDQLGKKRIEVRSVHEAFTFPQAGNAPIHKM